MVGSSSRRENSDDNHPGNKSSSPPRGVSWVILTSLCKPLMMNTTKNIRTSPGCGILGPVPGARPGDGAHMRAFGGRSNIGTRRSTGSTRKSYGDQLLNINKRLAIVPPTVLEDMREWRDAFKASSVELNIGTEKINTTEKLVHGMLRRLLAKK